MKVSNVTGYAHISLCKTYRYRLDRSWNGMFPRKDMVFIMLNPSTADAVEDDPTIRRCIGFANREGYNGIRVLNLFAVRETRPERIFLHDDPIGPENDEWISRSLGDGNIVAAWGSSSIPKVRERAMVVLGALHGREVLCLGMNNDGSPKHPLYLPGNAKLRPFAMEKD